MRVRGITNLEMRAAEEVMDDFFASVDIPLELDDEDIMGWNLLEITAQDPDPDPPTENTELADLNGDRSAEDLLPEGPIPSKPLSPMEAATSHGVNEIPIVNEPSTSANEGVNDQSVDILDQLESVDDDLLEYYLSLFKITAQDADSDPPTENPELADLNGDRSLALLDLQPVGAIPSKPLCPMAAATSHGVNAIPIVDELSTPASDSGVDDASMNRIAGSSQMALASKDVETDEKDEKGNVQNRKLAKRRGRKRLRPRSPSPVEHRMPPYQSGLGMHAKQLQKLPSYGAWWKATNSKKKAQNAKKNIVEPSKRSLRNECHRNED